MANTLAELIKTFETNVANNRDWLATYADNADYVIVSAPEHGTGLRIVNSLSATKHEFNFTGLGSTATGFTKKKAEELVEKWELKNQFATVCVMRKIDFVREYMEKSEAHLASFKKAEAK